MPYVLGYRKMRELLLTGDTIDAPEALAWGLVTRVVPGGRAARRGRPLRRPHRADAARGAAPDEDRAQPRDAQAMGLLEAVEANLDLSAMLNGADTPEQEQFERIVRERG